MSGDVVNRVFNVTCSQDAPEEIWNVKTHYMPRSDRARFITCMSDNDLLCTRPQETLWPLMKLMSLASYGRDAKHQQPGSAAITNREVLS